MPDNITSSRPANEHDVRSFHFNGKTYTPGKGTFKTDLEGLTRLQLMQIGYSPRPRTPFATSATLTTTLRPFRSRTSGPTRAPAAPRTPKSMSVQTASKVIQRCLLMTTDPGDLVLDPTCGSGTTATVAEQWGRRWITVDTSRVALALARARIMGARYPYYLLADSREGQRKEAEIARAVAILPSRP